MTISGFSSNKFIYVCRDKDDLYQYNTAYNSLSIADTCLIIVTYINLIIVTFLSCDASNRYDCTLMIRSLHIHYL